MAESQQQLKVDSDRLRRAMLDRGESARQLASRTGVDRGTVLAALSGRRQPRASTIAVLGRHLGVQPSTLWRRD